MNLIDKMPATVMLYKVTFGLVLGIAILLVTHPVDGVDTAIRAADHVVVLAVGIVGTTVVEFGCWLLDALVFRRAKK